MRKGATTYPDRLKNKVTMAGTPENPIAIDTYYNLYRCLDSEFYTIYNIYKWHKCGLYRINIDEIPYKWALSIKYLIEYNEILERNIF